MTGNYFCKNFCAFFPANVAVLIYERIKLISFNVEMHFALKIFFN